MTQPHSGGSFAVPVPVLPPALRLLSALPLASISTLLPVESFPCPSGPSLFRELCRLPPRA